MATETRTQAPVEEPISAHPPPPSPPTSPPGQSGESKRPPPTAHGKAYYGYLYNKDKTPTALLDALLHAIGKHIETEIGDKSRRIIDRTKLAAFYKAVGGDYDSLFVNAPDKSISYIWQALGVQHTLQPSGDDFAEPSVPALTLKGFIRWESIQILLEPDEHVAFVQYAVRNWALRHPDTGELFPADLPRDSFPAVCDPLIDDWHKRCAMKLRDAAPVLEKPEHTAAPDPRVHVHFTHVRPNGPSRHGPAMDYFERRRPDIPFLHIPKHAATGNPQGHGHSPYRHRGSGSSSPDERERRRRSFSDFPSPAQDQWRTSAHPGPRPPGPERRHSQPRHVSSPSSGSDSDAAVSPRSRDHRPMRPPTASVRVFPPDVPTGASAGRPSHRAELRQDDPRRSSLPSGHFGIRQKLSSFLPGSLNRPRSTSRSDRENDSRPNSARLRAEHPSSRLGHRRSVEDHSSEESDGERSPRYRSRHDLDRDRDRDREREREKIRERQQRERELEDERERRSRKDRAHLRPGVNRRTSSAAEIERRPREWDVRDRYRDRDRDRGREVRDPRRNLASEDRERRHWRDDERDRDRRRGGSPVVVGVGGRKYPTDGVKPAWA
ncbi:hypothetical protein JX265_007459 [Neoarthrinium moseri]|uniref:DUF7514 domain-containing protein n=1 Tax=Neoarthrinium moseri TaxID=1658444 RepID=A0A9P9WK74_9PEZI|nr:hypothetical protein JX266_012405 [Neoarthrinium moseri]KAI1867657.1 hypothetical protein JX265_007459 [Neoarthrinium moseri]